MIQVSGILERLVSAKVNAGRCLHVFVALWRGVYREIVRFSRLFVHPAIIAPQIDVSVRGFHFQFPGEGFRSRFRKRIFIQFPASGSLPIQGGEIVFGFCRAFGVIGNITITDFHDQLTGSVPDNVVTNSRFMFLHQPIFVHVFGRVHAFEPDGFRFCQFYIGIIYKVSDMASHFPLIHLYYVECFHIHDIIEDSGSFGRKPFFYFSHIIDSLIQVGSHIALNNILSGCDKQ